ncbi:MAG: ATP-grasp domain-containing protein [Acidimicrobiia bacterium]|nr:ATP-grasp domain-containing protein [Acidimicrobiia bacterium]
MELPFLYRLGIVGAGQIARMTYQAALKLGITPSLFAERFDDSAALAAPNVVLNHPDALAGFAADCQVLTFEHERIDIGLLQALEETGNLLRPGTRTIRAAFDKMHQRRILRNRGFNVPEFAEIVGPDDALDFAARHSYPIVLKTVRAAPPGQRGVWIVHNRNEAMKVLAHFGHLDLMAEEFQDIVKELVVLLVRRPGGNVRFYPISEFDNQDGQIDEIRAPADIGHRLATELRDTADRLANELEAVGVLAIEIFLTTDGLIINELAARPHNAGHYTIEGSPTSQFENHVRAVLDLPLGPTWGLHKASVTINVIGAFDGTDPAGNLPEALAVEGAHIHLYGKQPRPGRKLGHVTAFGDEFDQAAELARRAEAALFGRRHL